LASVNNRPLHQRELERASINCGGPMNKDEVRLTNLIQLTRKRDRTETK
jgi:hypothetical protein